MQTAAAGVAQGLPLAKWAGAREAPQLSTLRVKSPGQLRTFKGHYRVPEMKEYGPVHQNLEITEPVIMAL